jgi:hypothetical protein
LASIITLNLRIGTEEERGMHQGGALRAWRRGGGMRASILAKSDLSVAVLVDLVDHRFGGADR